MSSDRYVLGVSALFHDSAAALVRNGEVIAAAQEERFTRKKADWSFPVNAIDYCLSQMPGNGTLDALAFYENPLAKARRITSMAALNAPRGAPLWLQSLMTLDEMNKGLPRSLRAVLDNPEKIFFPAHHRSHAAAAFYPSPFEKAAIVVVDGVGEWSTTTIWSGSGRDLVPVKEMSFPASLGLLYSAFTQYCGFKVNSGEYKLMGLAPFGRPVFAGKILDNLIDLKPDGSFSLDLKYFRFHTDTTTISPLFSQLFGQAARLPSEPISRHFMNVAASIQQVTNRIMCALAQTALSETGAENLCLAGGVALNCVSNSSVSRNVKGLENIWVQPAAGDAGGAIGAALEVAYKNFGSSSANKSAAPAIDGMGGTYLGPGFEPDAIETALAESGLAYDRVDNDEEICAMLSAALQKQAIVGHFDGRMEYGPRALGNRSILADPRPQDMLQRVNLRIKFREGWRPFAPVISRADAASYFEAPAGDPYMLFVADLKVQYRDGKTLNQALAEGLEAPPQLQNAVTTRFPAVTHVDYSARVQVVDPHSPSRMARILSRFKQDTGCPMLLNTSFNVRGEPIVCNPNDAIRCFLNTHLDILALGPFIMRKEEQPLWARQMAGKARFDAD